MGRFCRMEMPHRHNGLGRHTSRPSMTKGLSSSHRPKYSTVGELPTASQSAELSHGSCPQSHARSLVSKAGFLEGTCPGSLLDGTADAAIWRLQPWS